MRLATIGAVILALASAFALYAINYDTRSIRKKVQSQERQILKAQSDIAALRAERAHLARPERVAPFARKLGLKPASGMQYVSVPGRRAPSKNFKDRNTAAAP